MRYLSYVDEPTTDAFRLDHHPQPGYGSALVSVWAVVTDKAGNSYNAMRGVQQPRKDASLNYGIYQGKDTFDESAPLVVPFEKHRAVEPYWVEQRPDAVVYGGESFELALGHDELGWTDAGGHLELTGARLGNPTTLWVPEQPEYDVPLLKRTQLAHAKGRIGDEEVEGVVMVDLYFSRPHYLFHETKLTRLLHRYWTMWLVEYDDGSLEGGSVWMGRAGSGLAHAHHYVDGRTLARNDASVDVTHHPNGIMSGITLHLGSDFSVSYEQKGCFDWPMHTYGKVSSVSRDKQPVKGWIYGEDWPANWGKIEDYQRSYADLYGRFPSLRGLLEGATLKDGELILARQ